MNHLRHLWALLLCLSLALLGACTSTPTDIPDGLSPAEYFQRAQEASDAGRYALAMQVYQRFQVDHPQERDRQLWASYEIALLHYKMGDSQAALEGFEALLQEYEQAEAAAAAATDGEQEQPSAPLPQGPRILAEKLKTRILEEMWPAESAPET